MTTIDKVLFVLSALVFLGGLGMFLGIIWIEYERILMFCQTELIK